MWTTPNTRSRLGTKNMHLQPAESTAEQPDFDVALAATLLLELTGPALVGPDWADPEPSNSATGVQAVEWEQPPSSQPAE